MLTSAYYEVQNRWGEARLGPPTQTSWGSRHTVRQALYSIGCHANAAELNELEALTSTLRSSGSSPHGFYLFLNLLICRARVLLYLLNLGIVRTSRFVRMMLAADSCGGKHCLPVGAVQL